MKLNYPKIDSLRLLIPLNEVIINKEHKVFTRTLTTINEDGEIVGTEENNSYRLHSNPCSSHYLNANVIIKGRQERVIKLGFSSKTLKDNYFDGITKDNINDVYNFILSEGVIWLSKETFLNARVVDQDICFDTLLQDSNVKDVISYAIQLSIPHKETNANAFTQKDNIGIEWGHRNKVGRSYLKKQYLKYYAKSIELKNNSSKFYNAYIKDNKELSEYLEDSKLLRVETTIKNNAHWNTYSLNVETLKDLLSLDLSKHLNVFERPINHYMTGANHINTRTTLTPNQKLQLAHLDLLQLHFGINEEEAIQRLVFTVTPDDRRKRHQYKKTLLKLVDENRVKKIKKHDQNQTDIITELEKLKLIPKE